MNHFNEREPAILKKSRRKFLQLAALGTGVSLLAATSLLREAGAAAATTRCC